MHTQWEFGVSGGSFVVFECYLHTYLYIYAKGLGEYGTYQSIYDVRLECRAWTCCLSKRKKKSKHIFRSIAKLNMFSIELNFIL